MHESLARWFDENQRPLPWRVAYKPYDVWISEIMLQQTQVATVVPYFERFIEKFPDAAALAAAEEHEVLGLWSGLGYYSRARNLVAAARLIVERHGGAVPNDYAALRSLPGIGEYTAGAIMSIAFDEPYPVVDGNVRRVLSRIYGWSNPGARTIREAAQKLVRQSRPRSLNQALMELGATVCSFKSPRCLLCPLQTECAGYARGNPETFPNPKKRPATVHVHVFAVVQQQDNRYLMRESEGLWEFPMFGEIPPGRLEHAGACRHSITHHRLQVNVYRGALQRADGFEWREFHSVPVSSLTRKIRQITENVTAPSDPS